MTHEIEAGKMYQLVVYDHVQFVNPKNYGITDFTGIDPKDYFITSGDAVIKATHLNADMWKLAGDARKHLQKSKDPEHKRFESDLWKAAGQARKLMNLLIKVKGTHIFLETDHAGDSVVNCIPKDPRQKMQDEID